MPSDNDIRVRTFTGARLAEASDAFQLIQQDVFSAWPYLLAGDPSAQPYITRYFDCPRSALFLATQGSTPVGAATCMPLDEESPNIQAPFLARGWDPRRFFYFGEGIIRAPWRGIGLGVRFFQLRESHARAVSTADFTVFCSVRRPPEHPLRPADPHTNDAFWRRRGYLPVPGLSCIMTWRDVDQAERTPHTLDFWIKSLNGAPLPAGAAA